MKVSSKYIVACALVVAAAGSTRGAVTNVGVDPGAPWVGFMNVFDLPSNGGGYVFGSSWGTADLTAVFAGPVLTLGANSVNDTSSFWYTPAGGPGAAGNKTMDANMYVESDGGGLSGLTVIFSGDVLSNTLVAGYTSVAFIKDFAPDFSSSVSIAVPLTPGNFSISLDTINDPTRHVQYGFETIGADAWVTDAASKGTVVVTASIVPEPSSAALLCGALLPLAARRRRA